MAYRYSLGKGGRVNALSGFESQSRRVTTKRRICWPAPDATCLEGGCIYCNDNPFRAVSTIERYARSVSMLPNRGVGEKDAMDAFAYGKFNDWHNAESR